MDQYFNEFLITRRVYLPMRNVGKNVGDLLKEIIVKEVEGKCIVHGYVKIGSVEVVTYSSGLLNAGDIVFDVIYKCLVLLPLEGMKLGCIIKSHTIAGIRAELAGDVSPLVIFVSREHYLNDDYYQQLVERSKTEKEIEINIKIIGQRFQLHDKQIRVIAELVPMEETSLSLALASTSSSAELPTPKRRKTTQI
jgi:DNA-directed RNA polymerase subunit E'/Rpb7